jgi:hypothetical protein
MSPLTIRFAGRISAEKRDRVAVATISPLVPTGSPIKKKKLILSLGGGTIDLEPGRYFIETWLPSGERLTDTVQYPEEQEALLYLSEEQESQLLGTPVIKIAGVAPEEFDRAVATQFSESPSVSLWLAPVVPKKDSVQALGFLQNLARVIQNDALTLGDIEPHYLKQEPGFTPNQTGQQFLYHLNHQKISLDFPRHRGFVQLRGNGLEYLLAVPQPWGRDDSGLDLMVARSWAKTDSVNFSLVLKNRELSTPLSYLAGGDAWQAGQLLDLDLMERMLQLKAANPLGAALGGYLLLMTGGEDGIAGLHNHQVWHDWLANLNDWFPWLPDGAVQHGWLKLYRQKGIKDVGEARLAFLEACRRGLPYFTKGLVMLVEGLRQLCRENSPLTTEECQEIDAWLDLLLPITWRADMSQVFLTIKLRMAKLPQGTEEH